MEEISFLAGGGDLGGLGEAWDATRIGEKYERLSDKTNGGMGPAAPEKAKTNIGKMDQKAKKAAAKKCAKLLSRLELNLPMLQA